MKLKIENARILITGGAGFIGSNLAEALLSQNNEVSVLDNFVTGKRENLASLLPNPSFKLIEGDIRSKETCRNAVAGVDYVLHEAALGSVSRSIKDPITSTEVNVTGFVNMLFAAKEAKVKRFVYATSSSVYGDSKLYPKTEDRIGKPLSPYAITKQANELFAANFSALYGVETIGLRYFNVFGRRQDPNGDYAAVVPKFVMALLERKSPVIYGDGSYSRDFTYIDNVVQANQLALLADNPEALNTVYNVAFGEQTTLKELFGFLRDALSEFAPEVKSIEPDYGAVRAGDIPHSIASIEKAKRLLCYAPAYNVKRGIKDAVRWYYENLLGAHS